MNLNVGAGTTVTGTALEKTGAGVLAIKGTQTCNSLATTAGVTGIYSAIGTGASAVTANATRNFHTVDQNPASLTVGAGVEVSFDDALPFADGGGKSGGFTPAFTPAPRGPSLGGSAVVPEPGSITLRLTGAIGLPGRRRKNN